jgi:dTDP-glucose pyrophosphorylase
MTNELRTTQAVILARGLGSRMRRETPDGDAAGLSAEQRTAAASGAKGMMPLGSRPFLDYVISALGDAGITEVVLVIGPEHQAVREYYSSGTERRVAVKFAVQAEPKGTADAVQSARGVVRDAPFLVMNSDNYYPVRAYSALAELNAAGLIAFEA